MSIPAKKITIRVPKTTSSSPVRQDGRSLTSPDCQGGRSLTSPDLRHVNGGRSLTRTRQTRNPERVKELVAAFATKHSNDDRKLFKSAWNDWIHSGEIDAILSDMANREEMENKLFFSARYYHRKKVLRTEEEEEEVQTDVPLALSRSTSIESTPEQKKPRSYIKTDPNVLKLIDDHLAKLPNDQNGFLLKPSAAFDAFVNAHGHEECKKIYKNRFYMKEKQMVSV